MPVPSPSPGIPAPAPSTSPAPTPKVATNPDGTPNLGSAVPTTTTSGQTTIWNLPRGIDPNKPLWFDIGHREAITAPRGGITNEAAQAAKGINPSSYEIMTTPDKIMAQVAAMSKNDPEGFLQIQLALASGPFGHVNVTGSWDGATRYALGQAMLNYVQLSQGAGVGISFKDYLLQAAQQATALKAQQQAGSRQQQVVTTDPDSIRQAAQSAAMDALGQGLSSDQLDAFVAKFQAAQTSAQTSTNGTVSSPDLSAEAAAYAQQQNPGEYKDNQRQAYLSSLVNLLGGNLTSRPTQQVTPAVGG